MAVTEAHIKALSPLQVAYKDTLDKDRLKLYALALSDVHPETLAAAVMVCIQSKTFFPSVAEIREAAWKISDEVNDRTPLDSGAAWELVAKAVRSSGYDRGLDELPEDVRWAATCVGWHELCYGDTSMRETRRAHFMRIYEGQQQRRKEQRYIDNAVEARPQLHKAREAAKLKSMNDTLEGLRLLAERKVSNGNK